MINKYRLYVSKAALLTIAFFLTFQINAQSSFAEEFVLPFQGEVEVNRDAGAFSIKNTGNGFAGNFELTKKENSNAALQGKTNGAGPGVKARATGSGTSLESVTTGSGSAGNFKIDNLENKSPAIRASTNGLGPAASFDGDVNISRNLSVDKLIKPVNASQSNKIKSYTNFNEGRGCENIKPFFIPSLETSIETQGSGIILLSLEPDWENFGKNFPAILVDKGAYKIGIMRDEVKPIYLGYASQGKNDQLISNLLAIDNVEKGVHKYQVFFQCPYVNPPEVGPFNISSYLLKATQL